VPKWALIIVLCEVRFSVVSDEVEDAGFTESGFVLIDYGKD